MKILIFDVNVNLNVKVYYNRNQLKNRFVTVKNAQNKSKLSFWYTAFDPQRRVIFGCIGARFMIDFRFRKPIFKTVSRDFLKLASTITMVITLGFLILSFGHYQD